MPFALLDLDVQCVGKIDGGPSTNHRSLGGHLGARVVVAEIQRQLVGVIELRCAFNPELALEIANSQVSEVEGALVGAREIGRDLGIGSQTSEVPAASPDRQ